MKTPRILLFLLVTLSLASVQAQDAATAPAAHAQGQIATLIEQGLNVIQWATADLQRAVPPEIRTNIVALKEDLQDEFKASPAASKDAYSKGVRLCNALIEVLDERDQKAAHAGFRAVEANARQGVSSQSLEVKRNYKMSWPQFAREQAERKELKGQAASNAEIMKARPMVEWSERAVVLRKTLDAIYAEYREAVRQSPITSKPEISSDVPAVTNLDKSRKIVKSPRVALPETAKGSSSKATEEFFVDKTWQTPTGTKYTFSKDGGCFRQGSHDTENMQWHHLGSDVVEVHGKNKQEIRYFRFITATEAYYNGDKNDITKRLQLK